MNADTLELILRIKRLIRSRGRTAATKFFQKHLEALMTQNGAFRTEIDPDFRADSPWLSHFYKKADSLMVAMDAHGMFSVGLDNLG